MLSDHTEDETSSLFSSPEDESYRNLSENSQLPSEQKKRSCFDTEHEETDIERRFFEHLRDFCSILESGFPVQSSLQGEVGVRQKGRPIGRAFSIEIAQDKDPGEI